MNRRVFLGSVASLSIGPLSAGCLQSQTEDVVKINEIMLANSNSSSDKRIHLSIRYDDTEIHNQTHTVSRQEGMVGGTEFIDDLPKRPGKYTITASLKTPSQTVTVDAAASATGECANFEIMVLDNGKIAIFPEKCESTS